MRGGCLCGAVRYQTEAKPVYQIVCHGRDCQRASGSGSAPVQFFPSDQLGTTGELRFFDSLGSSGKRIHVSQAAGWDPADPALRAFPHDVPPR